jgi:hypothetical protein
MSASFRAFKCRFAQDAVKTVKLKGFQKTVCLLSEEIPGETPTASELNFQFAGEGNTGIVNFLAIAGASGLMMMVYYTFIRRPVNYEPLGELVPLPFER